VIAKPFDPIYLRQHVAKSFLDSITPFFLPRFDHGKALRFDCGSKESGMKLQVSFFRLRKSLNIKQKGFAPAFPLTYSSVCVQSIPKEVELMGSDHVIDVRYAVKHPPHMFISYSFLCTLICHPKDK
jgi:hypothetical protein